MTTAVFLMVNGLKIGKAVVTFAVVAMMDVLARSTWRNFSSPRSLVVDEDMQALLVRTWHNRIVLVGRPLKSEASRKERLGDVFVYEDIVLVLGGYSKMGESKAKHDREAPVELG